MSTTVTAMYDTRQEAESARERLSQRVDADQVKIIDQSSSASSGDGAGGGMWESIKAAFMPDEDSHTYEEGIRRGGYLLCAEVDDEDEAEAMRLLEETNSVDFEERQQSWRNEGWTPYSGSTGGLASRSREQGSGERIVEEEHIPIVNEELQVGKRTVSRGGARVRSYVREVPVHEQINLRQEHVSVERRPVDQRIQAGGSIGDSDLLRERSIEMTETEEVPMVAKEAHVTEEMVVRKTAEEHMQDVDDTVRRTEVEVEEGIRSEGQRSAFGFQGDERSTEASRSDFERTDIDRKL